MYELHTLGSDVQATQHAFQDGPVRLGRSDEIDLTIKGDPQISRHHASLTYSDGAWHLADESSSNGSYVNDTKLKPGTPVKLSDRDRIALGTSGKTCFAFRCKPEVQRRTLDRT